MNNNISDFEKHLNNIIMLCGKERNFRATRTIFFKKLGLTSSNAQRWILKGKIPKLSVLKINKTFGMNVNYINNGEGEIWEESWVSEKEENLKNLTPIRITESLLKIKHSINEIERILLSEKDLDRTEIIKHVNEINKHL